MTHHGGDANEARRRLYGRGDELRRLERHVPPDPVGARALVVRGERGMGKSSVLAAAAEIGRGAGYLVLSLTGARNEAGLPFAALDDVVAPLLTERGDDLEPSRRRALALAHQDAEQAARPLAVSAAVLELFRLALHDDPILITIDDLPWLDPATAACLAYALRRLRREPVRVVVSAGTAVPGLSDDVPLDPHGVLGSLPDHDVLVLRGLGVPALSELLAERLGGRLPLTSVRHVEERTRGNPFWALEFARALPDHAADPVGPEVVPAALQDLVGRLGCLDDDVVEVAAVVATLGHATPGAVLDAAGIEGETVLDAAVSAGLVDVSAGWVRPSHPLVAISVLAALPPMRRARLHRAAARLAPGCEERAHQLVEAWGARPPRPGGETAGQRAELVDALDRAAESAVARGASRSALWFVRRARAFDVDTGDVDGTAAPAGDRWRRTVLAMRLLTRSGDKAGVLAGIGDVDLHGLDDDRLEQVLPLVVDATFGLHGSQAVDAVLSGLERRGRSPRRRALLLVLRTDPRYGSARRIDQVEAALASSEAAGCNASVVRRAVRHLRYLRLDSDRGADPRLHERHLVLDATADDDGDPADLVLGRSLTADGDLDQACTVLERCVVRTLAVSDGVTALGAGVSLAWARYHHVGPVAAADVVRRIETIIDPLYPEPPEMSVVRGVVALAAGEVGEAGRLIAELGARDRGPLSRTIALYLRGLTARVHEDTESAVDHLARFLEMVEERNIVCPSRRLLADVDLAECLVEVGSLSAAMTVADRLWRRPGHVGASLVRQGSADRIRALVHLARDRPDAAVRSASRAVARHRAHRWPAELGRSLLVLARAENVLGGAGSSTVVNPPSVVAAAEACAVLSGSGHHWWAHRAAALAGPVNDEPLLTSGERAVADLVARGTTDREIASALHLSLRAVERNLGAAMRKLNVRSRTALILAHSLPDATRSA